MTTATLKRSQSVIVTQSSPSTKHGSNPQMLPFHKGPSGEIRSLLGFSIPAAVLAPGTQITSATLKLRNYEAIAFSCTIVARRAVEKWSASTVTWNTRPDTDPTEAILTKPTSPKAGTWNIDVLEQVKEMQTAGKNYGFQITQSAGVTAGGRFLNYGIYVATLTIVYSTGPSLPTRLSPANGQVVSVPKPVLRITSEQLGEPIHQMQVQMDPLQDTVSPDFDSGWVDGTTAQLDTNAYGGAPTLAPSGLMSWRVRVRDIDGTTTAWSSWQQYAYEPLGTLTILEPAAPPDNIVTDPTPPAIWDLAGQAQAAYRVQYTDPEAPAGDKPLWDSGIVTSIAETTAPDVDIAKVVGKEYLLTVEAWDGFNRVGNGGNLEHVTATRPFTFELSADVEPVDDFTVIDMAPYPFVKLVFTRSEAPDGIQIIRDGVSIGVFPAADLLVSGDDYEFVDTLASPRREHTWNVRAIVNNETSLFNIARTLLIEPSGLWLSQPELDRYLPFITNDSQSVGLTEDGGTFNPLNGAYGVRVTSTLRGWSGTIAGEILATTLTGDALTGSGLRDLFLQMRADAGEPMVLTLLDLNIKVLPFNMTIAPTPTIGRNEDYVYLASFEFIEVP